MAKTINEFPNTTVGGLNISVSASDEALITGVFQGQALAQTMPARWPAVLFYSPTSQNFYMMQDLQQLSQLMEEFPDLRFFKAIRRIETT